MIRRLLFILLIIIAFVSVFLLIMQSTGETTIRLNDWSVEVKTSLLLLSLFVLFITLNFILFILRYLFSLRTRLKNMRAKRLSNKANKELIQGLLLIAEGHWDKAEKLLLKRK